MSTTDLIPKDSALSAVARKLATELLADEAVALANKAAASLSGIVITSNDEAGRVTDLTKSVRNGGARLKEALQRIIKPFKEAADEARETVRETVDTLAAAEKSGRGALDAWQEEQERISREAERKARDVAERVAREQEELARKARDAAVAEAALITAETGVEVPPVESDLPAIVPPVEVYVPEPDKIRGETSSAGKMKKLNAELFDANECPWLMLDNKTALAEFHKSALKPGARQLEDDSIIWNGVRFFYTTSTVIR